MKTGGAQQANRGLESCPLVPFTFPFWPEAAAGTESLGLASMLPAKRGKSNMADTCPVITDTGFSQALGST